jgi:transcription initiation factor TFIIH subunit 3
MAVMNGIFAASKLNVAIDACCLSENDSGLLQQAAELTGGLYLKLSRGDGLLEYLMVCAARECL